MRRSSKDTDWPVGQQCVHAGLVPLPYGGDFTGVGPYESWRIGSDGWSIWETCRSQSSSGAANGRNRSWLPIFAR